jgi:hypothetical protein
MYTNWLLLGVMKRGTYVASDTSGRYTVETSPSLDINRIEVWSPIKRDGVGIVRGKVLAEQA